MGKIIRVQVTDHDYLIAAYQKGLPGLKCVQASVPREAMERVRSALKLLDVGVPRGEIVFEFPPISDWEKLVLPAVVGALGVLGKTPAWIFEHRWLGKVHLDGAVDVAPFSPAIDKLSDILRETAPSMIHLPETRVEMGDQPLGMRLERMAAVAAFGRHHLLILGPPGVGKTTFCGRVMELVPFLANVTLGDQTISPQTLKKKISPGGVLFLDEFLEYRRDTLESLRWEMERPLVDRVQLLAASNLCPCGRWNGDPYMSCGCSLKSRSHYLRRLSGPVVDRMEMLLFFQKLGSDSPGDGRGLICQGFAHQDPAPLKESFNWVKGRELKALMRLSETIARLDGKRVVDEASVLEALIYRQGVKELENIHAQ